MKTEDKDSQLLFYGLPWMDVERLLLDEKTKDIEHANRRLLFDDSQQTTSKRTRRYANFFRLSKGDAEEEELASNPFASELSKGDLNSLVNKRIKMKWKELSDEEKNRYSKCDARGSYAQFVKANKDRIRDKQLASNPFISGKELNERVFSEIGIKWRAMKGIGASNSSGKSAPKLYKALGTITKIGPKGGVINIGEAKSIYFLKSDVHYKPFDVGDRVRVVYRSWKNGTDLKAISVKPLPDTIDGKIDPPMASPQAIRGGRALNGDGNVHVFIDVPNVLFGSQAAKLPNGRIVRDKSVRVIIPKLIDLVESNRSVATRVAVGSHNSEPSKVWKHVWQAEGYNTSSLRRDFDNKENGVDEFIHAQISRLLLGKRRKQHTIVLLTGDGNLNHGKSNFPEIIESALRKGWIVELWSWGASVNTVYTKYARVYQRQFHLRLLDYHRDLITYLKK